MIRWPSHSVRLKNRATGAGTSTSWLAVSVPEAPCLLEPIARSISADVRRQRAFPTAGTAATTPAAKNNAGLIELPIAKRA